MNSKKLKEFINLIDNAIAIADQRKTEINTDEYKQFRINYIIKICDPARKEKILNSNEIEKELNFSFALEWLNRFIHKLEFLKENISTKLYEEDIKLPKGKRPRFGLGRAALEYDIALGEPLYNYELSNALAAVEKYFDEELD